MIIFEVMPVWALLMILGASQVIRPKYFNVANAVGAAIAQVCHSHFFLTYFL
jgi:hypothetical protein